MYGWVVDYSAFPYALSPESKAKGAYRQRTTHMHGGMLYYQLLYYLQLEWVWIMHSHTIMYGTLRLHVPLLAKSLMIAVHSWLLVSFCWKSQPYFQNSFSYERWWA
jgi:hypothetical protein